VFDRRITLLLALLLPVPLLAAIAAASFESASPDVRTLGPAGRTPNGRFVNQVGEISHGDLRVRFPFFLRRIGGSFRDRQGIPERVSNDGAFLRENASHSVPTVTWVGHSTLLVQMDHVTFLTDPIWSDTPSPIRFVGPKRFVEPGLAFEDLPPIDFVLVSHNHYDHLDLPSLKALALRDPRTRFFVPLGNGALLRGQGVARVSEFDWGDTTRFEGVTIHCLPAQHWSKRGAGDDLQALWSSWAVSGAERRFFFAGDTGYFDGFARIGEILGPFDLAAMPIGAYAPREMMKSSHLNPEEAVRGAIELRGHRALAIHFGTIDLSDEPLDEPPRRFRKAAAASPLGAEAAWVLRIGETRPF
jgi:N-acyl-phosphatidylethanolamine-hydrolysing phospholipase D